VSLTEDSPREIEVCRDLLAQIPRLANLKSGFDIEPSFDPFAYSRRQTPEIEIGRWSEMRRRGKRSRGRDARRLGKVAPENHAKADVKPEAVYEDLNILKLTRPRIFQINLRHQLVTVKDGVDLPASPHSVCWRQS